MVLERRLPTGWTRQPRVVLFIGEVYVVARETRRKKLLYVGLYLYSKLDTGSGIGRVCEDRRNRR